MNKPLIVLDNGNYKSSYAEETPFLAAFIKEYDNNVVVVSLETGKEYELYKYQILEFLDIEEIKNIIDLKKYGQ